MKKFLSLILCLSFIFCLTACSDKKEGSTDIKVDVEYYAKLGKISGSDYQIGDDVEDTKTSLNTLLDDHGNPLFFEFESSEYTIMNAGEICCCYKTDDKNSGITHVIKYGEAYGFALGTVSTQVRDVMSDLGYDATEREAKSGELFFMPATGALTVLEYKIKNTTVLFVFDQHSLSATVIFKK